MPFRKQIGIVTQVFLITRGMIFVTGYVGRTLFQDVVPHGIWVNAKNAFVPDASLFFSIWYRWDSQFYHGITQNWYLTKDVPNPYPAFFPGYPILVALTERLTGLEFVASGVLVSNASFFFALLILFRLVYEKFDDETLALKTILYVSLFPSALFFSAIYTESLFLLLSVLIVYLGHRNKWILMGVCGAMISATRPTGILLFGAMVLYWLETIVLPSRPISFRQLKSHIALQLRPLAGLALMPVGLFGFMYYLYDQFEDPLLFSSSQLFWGRSFANPLTTVLDHLSHFLTSSFRTGDSFGLLIGYDSIITIVFCVSACFVYKKFGFSMIAYVLLAIVIPLASGQITAMARYMSVLFPIFVILADWGMKASWFNRLYLVTASFLQAVLLLYFVNWGFAG